MNTTTSRWITVLLVLLIVAAVVLFVVSFAGLLRVMIIAALIAYLLDPLATTLESRGLSRTTATVVLFTLLMIALTVFSLLIFPAITEEIVAFQTGEYDYEANAIVARVETFLKTHVGFLGGEGFKLGPMLQEAKAYVSETLLKFVLGDVVSTVAHLVAIPFVVFFLLKDGREMKKHLISLVPNRYFEFSLNLIHKMDTHLGNFLRGQFLDAMIFGSLVTLSMWALDVNYFFFIGAFAGLANLIPYVGPIAGGLLAVGVVIVETSDVSKMFYVVIAFVIAKLIDDALIQPLAVAKSVHMHPLTVLLAVIIGGQLFGILGMLVAVPCAGFIQIVVLDSISLIRKYSFKS